MTVYHIGVDSTDSAELGMCTTYLGARLLEALTDLDIDLISPPELIRLNPNVPWKTRGNGAVCLRYEGGPGLESNIFSICEEITEELSVLQDPQTNPGLVLLTGDVPDDLSDLYGEALHRIVEVDRAKTILKGSRCLYRGWKNERGLIGAAAAIGADLLDHTYELILYRDSSVKDRERSVDHESIRKASRYADTTFFNVDTKGEILCIPHSPCPIILGLRGVDPVDLIAAASIIEIRGLERWVLWRTNQHTDAHIEEVDGLDGAEDYSSISISGLVSSDPEYGPGGHLYFDITDREGDSIQCAAYEPTKKFRKSLSALIPGDRIRAWGGIRPADVGNQRTLNLEKIRILNPAILSIPENPLCGVCGGRMESMGRGQGLRCKKCGQKDPGGKKIRIERTRDIIEGLIETPPAAWRHLYRPSLLPERRSSEEPEVYFGNDLGTGS